MTAVPISVEEDLERVRAHRRIEEVYRRESMREAARRLAVKKALADPERLRELATMLEPPSPEIDLDENEATLRFLETEKVLDAAQREVARAYESYGFSAEGETEKLPEVVAKLVVTAYDDDHAAPLDRIAIAVLSAERVLEHLLSFEALAAWIPMPLAASVARRLTVVLYNRRYLLPYRKGPLAPPEPEPVAVVEHKPALCLDCGAPQGSCDCGGGA